MTARFELFLERAVARFMDGDPQRVAERAVIPLPVHIEEAFISFQTRDALVRALEIQRRYLRTIHVTSMRGTLTALELPRHQRFRAWVELQYFVGETLQPPISKVIFYGRYTGHSVVIEMVQYVSFAYPRIKQLIPSASWTT